jgi:holo-[acyl-carrier protein] synthase
MILGIGTDITNIERIADALARQGERFQDRCFGSEERSYIETAAKGDAMRRAAGYAKRWAAKEACAKALGLGIREHIFLKDIAVVNDTAGAPGLLLSGGAKERLTQITPEGMTASIYVSLSDEPPMALAFVVISAEPAK